MKQEMDRDECYNALERFYTHYQVPEKISGIDKLLETVAGKESRWRKLCQQLEAKYGPFPDDDDDDDDEDDDEEDDENAKEAPVEPPPPVPAQTNSKEDLKLRPIYQRVHGFYQRYNPSKLEKVEDLVRRTKNKPAYEERLMRMLMEKYNVREENPAEEADQPEKAEEDNHNEEHQHRFPTPLHRRLYLFYSKYQPEKLNSIDAMVEKINGNNKQEEQLFNMLVQKYGPEPSDDEEDEEGDDEEDEEDDDANEEGGGGNKIEAVEQGASVNEVSLATDDGSDDNALFRKVIYCPIDGMPPEYSEYLTTFKDALPWLAENCPDLVLVTKDMKTVKEYLGEGGLEEEEDKKPSTRRAGAARPNKQLLKQQAKQKEREAGTAEITIERVNRNKKRFVTILMGLDAYDPKLKQVAKKLGKKFASGASVNKLPGGGESIEIQGDFVYDLPEVLVEEFQVNKECIFFKEGDSKNKAF